VAPGAPGCPSSVAQASRGREAGVTDLGCPGLGQHVRLSYFSPVARDPHGVGSTDGYFRCCWCFSGEERATARVSESYSALVCSTSVTGSLNSGVRGSCLGLLQPGRPVKWPAASKGLGAGGNQGWTPSRCWSSLAPGGVAVAPGVLHEAWHTRSARASRIPPRWGPRAGRGGRLGRAGHTRKKGLIFP